MDATPSAQQLRLAGEALAPRARLLRGRYVRLEPLAASHAKGLFNAVERLDQRALQRFTADPECVDAAAMEALVQSKAGNGAAAYFACIPEDAQAACGFLCLMRADPPHRVIEIGNVLFGEGLRRTRAGAEAVYLIARHAFEELGYRRLEWKCNDLNAASRNAALRYGFVFEGVFRQHMMVKGRNRDTAWYSMLDREWTKRKEAFEAWLAPDNFDAEGRQLQSLAELNGVGSS